MVMKTDALSALISLIEEQWLGGVVNMKNWSDVWLLEGSMIHLRHAMIEKAHNIYIYIFATFINFKFTHIKTKYLNIDSHSN